MLLDQNRFEADVLEASEPVLVDFFGSWCPPCRELAPTIDRISQSGAPVCKVNIDDRPDLASQFGVNAVPTVVIFKGGEEVARFVGVQPERTLRKALDRARGVA